MLLFLWYKTSGHWSGPEMPNIIWEKLFFLIFLSNWKQNLGGALASHSSCWLLLWIKPKISCFQSLPTNFPNCYLHQSRTKGKYYFSTSYLNHLCCQSWEVKNWMCFQMKMLLLSHIFLIIVFSQDIKSTNKYWVYKISWLKLHSSNPPFAIN